MTNLGDIVRSEYYATHGYPHEAWTQLRPESPVARFELDGYDPFWAVTRYDGIPRLPPAVIPGPLGVPRDDWKITFEWTNQATAPAEPEYRQGKTVAETAEHARAAMFDYFARYVAERRRAPREDLVSVLVQSRIEG